MSAMHSNFPRRTGIAKPTRFPVATKCCRCGGDGVWKGWRPGTCFRCGGSGQDPTPDKLWFYPADWTEEQCEAHVAKLEAQRVARADRKAAKEAAKLAAVLAQHPVLAKLEAMRVEAMGLDQDTYDQSDWANLDYIARDIFFKAAKYDLSEKQVAVCEQALVRLAEHKDRKAQEAAAKESAEPVPTGKVTITGEVATTKWQDTQFGSTLKMLVVDDRGFKVWGTVPRKLNISKGDRVTFSATVEPSRDDDKFGFFSRPTKGEVLEGVAM